MKIFTRDLWKYHEVSSIALNHASQGYCNAMAHLASGVLVMCERKGNHKGRHWTKLPDVSITWTGDDSVPRHYYKD